MKIELAFVDFDVAATQLCLWIRIVRGIFHHEVIVDD